MSSREIQLWIDERWYGALKQHLGEITLESRLQATLAEMCKEIPSEEYDRISSEIAEEDLRNQAEREANRRLAIFHIRENGSEARFAVDERIELLGAARLLRSYLQSDTKFNDGFAGRFRNREPLTLDAFNAFAAERMENTGRVTGAYAVDLDNGIFSALNIMDGWQSFTTKDVSTAAYHAFRKTAQSMDERLNILVGHLAGKELSPDEFNRLRTIRAVVFEPRKVAQIKEIGASLNALQAIVGSQIQEVTPFEDSAVLLCNLEGKVDGLPLNRALRDEDGDICDIVAGTFVIVNVSGTNYESLTEEMAKKYSDIYRIPERVDYANGKFLVSKLPIEEWEPIYLSGSRRLEAKDISMAEDIIQNDNLLEFYLEVVFDPDKVFGTHVCTDLNDDYVNVYANYNMETGQVCDDLEVYLVKGDGDEQDYKYRLTDEEKAYLLPKMEEYCQQCWGQSLNSCRKQFLSEQAEVDQLAKHIGKTVQSIVESDAPRERVCFSHKNTGAVVWLCQLDELTASGECDHSALLNATVTQINHSANYIELELEGISGQELDTFCEDYDAHQQAEQAMGPTI